MFARVVAAPEAYAPIGIPAYLRSHGLVFGGGKWLQRRSPELFATALIVAALIVAYRNSWRDGTVEVDYTPRGFAFDTPGLTWSQRLIVFVSAPLRRIRSENWFTPLGQIGSSNSEVYALRRDEMLTRDWNAH